MNKYVALTSALFLMSTGAAMAQSSSYQSTTTVMTPGTPGVPGTVVGPTPGTLSVDRSQHTVAPDGTETTSKSTVYRNGAGVASQSETKTVAPLAVPPTTYESTTRKTTTTTIP